MKVFLGTNFGHGSSVAVLDSKGSLVFAVEEGRLIGRKECSNFPDTALGEVLRIYSNSVSGWCEGWNASHRLIFKGLGLASKFFLRDSSYWEERLLREWRRYRVGQAGYKKWGSYFGKVRFLSHHEEHAFSLVPWGFPTNSLVLVSDYIGERWSISCFYWANGSMRTLARIPFPHSIGAAYNQLASHLGYRGSTAPGKVMALSAYGEPKWLELLETLVHVSKQSFMIDQVKFPIWMRRQAWQELGKRIGGALGAEISASSGNWEKGIDLAASAQAWFTETTWKLIGELIRHAREDLSLRVRTLGLAGGCALNCQANGAFVRRLETLGIEQLVVSPWSDDSGTAIGAAVHAALLSDSYLCFEPATAFLGPHAYIGEPLDPMTGVNSAVSALAGGVVALAIGRLEFGPRALGGRCLLADPRRADIRDQLNRIKGRPAYMPFAPAVLAEDFDNYFDGVGSKNMAWTVKIRPDARAALPGLDHPSGEARVQVVGRGGPAILRALLFEWRRETGYGVLLLTSLNGSGEAIPDSMTKSIVIARRLGANGILTDRGWISFG